jgi:hypothetical protein
LEEIIAPETAGDPMSEQKWVRSSLRHLSEKLKEAGHTACPKTVARLLKKARYSLRVNSKRLAGAQHPDRNLQFEYIQAQKELFLSRGWPVISVDAKKKELIGDFRNAGRCWCQVPEAVNDHDFESEAICKVVPYGIYDLNHHRGYVYVSQSADTAQFAVEMIARWWRDFGKNDFPHAPALLTLCDGGGSNGWRSRLWKLQLQEQLADQLNLEVMVCHYPKNASKWNPIEHRLFGPISLNWEGKPLRTLGTMLAYIRGTTTQTGLQVAAFQVNKAYPRGIKVENEVMESLNLERHSTCPNWNYTIRPRPSPVCV